MDSRSCCVVGVLLAMALSGCGGGKDTGHGPATKTKLNGGKVLSAKKESRADRGGPFPGAVAPADALPPAVTALQNRCRTEQPGVIADWDRAKASLTSRQECAGELGNLMKGMEFLSVTLVGSLQDLEGADPCWRVSVPTQGKFTGYNVQAMVGCLDAKDLRVLAVYLLPKP